MRHRGVPAHAGAALLALCLATPAAAQSSFRDAELSLVYDANASRSERSADVEQDFVLRAAAGGGRRFRSGAASVLELRASVTVEAHRDFADLGSASPGAALTWRYKPTPGFSAPWYTVTLAADLIGHRDSALRDGARGAVSAVAARRLTDRITGRAGYGYELRRAFHGEVFDTEAHRLFAALDYAATRDLTLYGVYRWRTGEVVSNATPNPRILAAAEAVEADGAFGRGRNAYRIEATVQAVDLGANLALGERAAVDARARYFAARGKLDNDYDGVTLTAGMLWRF